MLGRLGFYGINIRITATANDQTYANRRAATRIISSAFSFNSYVTPRKMLVIDLTGGAPPHPLSMNLFSSVLDSTSRLIRNAEGYRTARYSESSCTSSMTENYYIALTIDIDDGMRLHCRRTSVSGAMYDARLVRQDTHNI
jgi:hypothetical protein